MNAEKVGIEYIESLVKMRLAYLIEDNGRLDGRDLKTIQEELPAYFRAHIGKDLHVYAVRDGQSIVSCAFLLVVEKPMSPAFINGRTGIVLNVYTCPKYRRRGYAKKIMEMLLAGAKELGLSVVELKSTEDGYHLYRSMGFDDDCNKYHLMKWENPELRSGGIR